MTRLLALVLALVLLGVGSASAQQRWGRVDEGIREAFVAQSRRALPHVEGAAMILLRTGFGGAAMRAAVSSGLVLVRPSVPVRTFSRVEDGVQWLCGLSSPPRDARAILATTVSMSEALLENYTP